MHFLAGGGDGQTPLDGDEAAGLIPTWVATRGDVNQAEAGNIARGLLWVGRSRPSTADILEERFIRRLHERMLGDVWRWAGTYRTSNKNIGVDYWLIAEQLGQLLADCRYWLENGTYEPDELAVRFHHRLAAIHPFPNGNGRLARAIADELIVALGGRRFSWGAGIAAAGPAEARRAYIEALHVADDGDLAPLLEFARS
ncbi:MAG TPA: mobile mystery protein B [Gaiellaceae bacterium]|jgi:Fic-DOC domain mobile mystery protein B